MSDIFISYASEDRSRAEPLAKALEEQGWSVWWDRTIPPGKTFDQVIEEAIKAARCVVVLWSKVSIKSDWVKEEANIGKQRKILVPARIDPVDPPIGFGRIQAADLTDWEIETSHAGFAVFLSAISDIVGPPPQQEKPEQVAKIPESNLEQQLEAKAKESETFQPVPSHLEPDEKESPITGPKAPRKKRLAFGIGGIALIIVLSVIGWFLYSKPGSYTITASSGPNGSISPTGSVTVLHRRSRAFEITPKQGYRIADVRVDGKSVVPESSYTFENVISDRTISATFEQLPLFEKVGFNPQKEILQLPNKPEFNPGNQITLEAWFNTDDLGTRQAIIYKPCRLGSGGEPYYQYNLELRQGGTLYFALAINGVRRYIDGAFLVKPKTWYHVTATYDGSWMRLYLNETEWLNPYPVKGTLNIYPTPLDIGIGKKGSGNPDRPFKGLLAEVRIWNVARTIDLIRDDMHKRIWPTEKGLVWSSTNYIMNLALRAGAKASQSTTAYGGPAERAIDGNTDGNFSHRSVTHTDNKPNSWWQVRLPKPAMIEEIVIWNRSDCCGIRLSNFRVSILDDSEHPVGLPKEFKEPVKQGGSVSFKPEAPVKGRYVKVQIQDKNKEGNGFLSLAEVQVFGEFTK